MDHARWIEERSRWREIVVRCPVFHDDRNKALRARVVSTTTILALALFVMVENVIHSEGTPYYFIWLTNWTGLLTGTYAVTFCWATVVAAREEHTVGNDDGINGNSQTQIPLAVRILWRTKAAAPVCQLLITIMYWGLLYSPKYTNVTADNVVAHGGLCFMMVTSLTLTARMSLNNLIDLWNTYAFLLTYMTFNIIYTLAIPNGENNDGQPYVYEILHWNGHPERATIVVVVTAFIMVPISYGVALGLTTKVRNYLFPDVGLNAHTRPAHTGAVTRAAA